MPAIRPSYISTGEAAIKIVSETLDGCFGIGCLSNAGYGYEKNMRAEYCSNRSAPLFYEALTPGFRLDISAKELSAVNFHLMGGSALPIVTGSDLTTLLRKGNPTAASGVTSPAEWHIVEVGTSFPSTFNVYTELKDLWAADGTFTKAVDIEVYTAAKTNGDTNVSGMTTLYETGGGAPSDAAKGSFEVVDACTGKVQFRAIPDALLSQWTWNPSDPPFLINGVAPHVDPGLTMGDTVALIGIAYFYGGLEDGGGDQIAVANRSVVQYPTMVEKPVAIKLVHRHSQNPDHVAQILRVWRAFNTTGFSHTLNPMTTVAHTLDSQFRAVDASDIMPDSPLFHIETVESSDVLTWEGLLGLAAA